ncbi:MAG: acetylornithine deacetylase, partial [Homoserinimonas sp.]|nr:acetylornithine deacetylase [Homoserinimonas sp.]
MTSPLPPRDDSGAIARLQELVRIPTVSHPDESQTQWSHFEHFIGVLPSLYPMLHATLEREVIGGYSLLYRWKGRSMEAPIVLMAHYDVVPASDEGWKYPPFSATVTGDGNERLIWGRGTLDDKGSLVTVLEAVEGHVAAGFVPANDVYLSFGHNEETAGDGAGHVVETLARRGVRPALVLDEGGAVVEGIFPGVGEPIAVVGVAEKGVLTLTMTVDQEGGHASTPPRVTATARLAKAIVAMGRRRFRAGFTATNLEMIGTLGAHARNPLKLIFTNLWLTKRLLLVLFDRLGDETSAMVRTTHAVTQLSASQAANVLAERAVATVNIRVAVGSSVAEAVEHVRKAIRDPAVQLDVFHPSEPSPVSPTSGPAWTVIKNAIEETYPGTIVTPYVMLGASDSRHFTSISEHVYRF